jgi:hypothetical protein
VSVRTLETEAERHARWCGEKVLHEDGGVGDPWPAGATGVQIAAWTREGLQWLRRRGWYLTRVERDA